MTTLLLLCFTVSSSMNGGASCLAPIPTHSPAECQFLGKNYTALNGKSFVRYRCVRVSR